MSVGGIQSTFASNQVGSIAATNALKYARTQQLSSSNLDVPSDEATLQQGGNSSASSSSQGLTAIQKAYEFLQQAGTTAVAKPVGPDQFSGGPVHSGGITTDPIEHHEPMPPILGPHQFGGGPVHSGGVTTDPIEHHEPMPPIFGPHQFSGGPVQSKGVTTDPIQTHEPMPPVFGLGTNLPNPIQVHDPLLPGPGSTTNLPIPTQFHDPLDPPTPGTTTSVLA
jgi:hypothetical protein